MGIWIKKSLVTPGMFHLRCRVLLKQMSYYGLFRMSWRYNSYKSALLVASPNRHAPILPLLNRYPLRLFKETVEKEKVENVSDLQCNCKLPLALFGSTRLLATPRQRCQKMLLLFRMLKLFPSVGTKVVKHSITVGVHRSFP